ncbi:GTP cyclohydrolase FolE2 [Lentibacillus populi]|uniref:GTP cyclohydrolase FolE2 n=1 Tax=Lentibacillus populi TaxID=1827502 RepID=A0A9W5X4D5_9BACI|nr:GTP cyclohydrolase FolE2 [Lentibacillus populi]MBT2214998.1 GTP cyclohydrolase I FolE2 [Virgibacillus dakarensis]GGB31171.1 GTP cyclohydrolase FolE2 [Lentibacillus populi]
MNKFETLPKKQLPNKAERHKLFGSVEPGPKTKPVEKSKMADLQNTKKDFLFDLDEVGITNVKHPIVITSNLHPETQTSIGTFRFTSAIEKTSKGTNMSRFTEQLNLYHEAGFSADIATLKRFTKDLAERLKQRDAEITVTFPWFYERRGPQSDLSGMNHADCGITVAYDQKKGFNVSTSLSVPVTTLCPCSKEISEYSAHNQRGYVTMEINLDDNVDETKLDWKEQLLNAAESNASSRLHPVLKRPDEKMVTEAAYENPRFVEDMVRLVAADLYEMPFVKKFKVVCRNEESIHMHDAIASVTYDKKHAETSI